ncbi:hypothetical protein CLU79DRAFT_741805 [Phycomyces nitens]|nr:hypothetical protein CLU79DRAFT_741805 [Phycomyces nitens]
MTGDTKLILSLINRITTRLPSNSGKKIDYLENDPMIKQTVAALVDLSKYRLPVIASVLTGAIETATKPILTTRPDELISCDILQSQLYLLRILSVCMQHHWRFVRDTKRTTKSEKPLDPIIAHAPAAILGREGLLDPKNQINWNPNGMSPDEIIDPPPLDDNLARLILSVMSRIMHQMVIMEDRDPVLAHSYAINLVQTEYYTAIKSPDTTSDLMKEIYKAASKVMFYLSASNWTIVFSKIKSRILYLSTTIDENPDTSEMRFLECSSLNKNRLVMVLTEISSSFIHLKKSAQLVVALVLRRAIWNWIETYPYEFMQLYHQQRRIEGGADALFDICCSLADTTRKKAVFWPFQTMLLVVCPDLLFAATVPDGRNASTKKTVFFGTLRKSIKGGMLSELAAVCFVDILKASTFVSKNDMSLLKNVLPEVELELKRRLFDMQKPLPTDNSLINVGMPIDHCYLMADCIVAMFRLDPLDTINTLFSMCTFDRAPTIFKQSAIKAALVIAMEHTRLPWIQPLQTIYTVLCEPIRKILLDFYGRDNIKHDTSTSRKPILHISDKKQKKDQRLEVNERNDLVLDILRLYQVTPRVAILGSSNYSFDQNSAVIFTITNCLRDPLRSIREAAADCIYTLHQPSYIMSWGSPDLFMETFWKISSQVLFIIAKQLLDSRFKDSDTRKLLDLLKMLLEARNKFLREHQDLASQGHDIRERIQSGVGLEVALLVLVCSSDMDVYNSVISCFDHMCVEAQLTESDTNGNPNSIILGENLPVYAELVSGSSIISGRKSQQKRVCKSLRMMPTHSPGNLAAWEEVWKRWKTMSHVILRPHDDVKDDASELSRKNILSRHDKSKNSSIQRQAASTLTSNRLEGMDDDKWIEWQNYAAFLASLGGVCLMASATKTFSSSSSGSSSTKGSISYSDFGHMSQRFSAATESSLMVDQYLLDMVELLISDNVLVREWAREILGNDLSPALYPTMFRHLENTLQTCFGANNDPICEPQYTLFVEQAISVLKLVLNRLEDNVNNMFTVDFSNLIHQYAQYLNRLGCTEMSTKIKIKMCQLCEVLMDRKDRITLRQEFKLRNKLLEIIVEWTSDFALPDGTTYSGTSTNMIKFQRELDLACLKTIVALLQQLPLQTSEPLHDTDSSQLKSRIFYKYFTFFLKLLNRCRLSEIGSTSSMKRIDNVANFSVQVKENAGYISPLKNFTILALSNLLSANIDIGLKYSLSMGYHEDSRTRSAFMQVLTNVLNQGTEFETLSETVMTDRYEKLIDMLVDYSPNIILSLCEACPASDIDNVVQALLVSFRSRNKTMVLLKALIEREVQTTASEVDLFRKSSVATRLLSIFAKMNGSEYVRSVLRPVFLALGERSPSQNTYELDPSKVGPNENVVKNKENVITATEMFLDAICSSADQAPISFHEVCHCITTIVRTRFPEASNTAVGSFVFLRFFCPAIVSPESEDLLKHGTVLTREMRRGYLLSTKIIQNLANNVLFGSKEAFMIVLNDFLTKNIYKVASFLRIIAKVPEDNDLDTITETRVEMSEKDYALLHRVLFDNMERISRDLATRRTYQSHNQEILSGWRQDLDKFANLLAQLGKPPEVLDQGHNELKNFSCTATNQLFAEFMRRNHRRNVDVIVSKSIFYEGGVSKAGRTVFYYIARHVVVDSIDFELMVYHILQTMERLGNKSFELVIDLTQFNQANEIPNQWVNQLLQVLPFGVSDRVENIIVMNPNSHLRKYMKKLLNPVHHKIVKKMTLVVSMADLHEYIAPSEVRLPKSTIGLETVPSAMFFPVNRIMQFRTLVPITMKVSAEYVQLTTVRKQEIFIGISTVMNDVFHISEIDNIETGQHGQGLDNMHVFNFRHGKDRLNIVLHSLKKDVIVGTLRHSKQRYEASLPTALSERVVRPNDVPGRLLNMALLNIGSVDPNLRLSAYNLLYSLSRAFNFDVGRQLLDAKDLCLPSNSTEFVVSISKRLAASEPNLTLEFLNECFVGFQKSNEPLRYLCLDYMRPWLPNLSLFCRGSPEDLAKTKDIIRLLIDLTISRTDMYKLIQAKVWKTIGRVEDILDLVLDTFIFYSNEHGVGSIQAETMADTFVTLSNVVVRGKLVTRLRKVLQKTSFKPTRTLTSHVTWTEIAVLIRFLLMVSFNNHGPVKSYLPEIFYIVSLVVGVGPTLVRASVHGIVINVIQSLCTSMPISDTNVKKLQLLLEDMSGSKARLLFGLAKPHTNAFTIATETTTDTTGLIHLTSLESIVNTCLEVLQYSTPSTDLGNAWRARWMSLVASTAFQFNPAIQPRAFVVLGCLGREEVDDDLLYQILVALRGALAIFNESDPSLVMSIMMCLKNIVRSLPTESRYLPQLFWVAIALLELNNSSTFGMAVSLLQAVLNALEVSGFFEDNTISSVLLAAREPVADIARKLDGICGVNFDTHFSFAISGIFIKGLRYNDCKDSIYQGLTTFLNIECKHMASVPLEEDVIGEAQTLGYITVLLPIAAKNEVLKDLLRIAGINELDVDNIQAGGICYGLFDKLDIPDNTTALLLISLLATQLNCSDSESERLFIYGLLAEAAVSMPDVFHFVYELLLPKMNQIVISSQTQAIMESVKTILLTACSDPVFIKKPGKPTLKSLLQELRFSSLCDPTFGVGAANSAQNAKLASELVERVIA